MSHRGGERGRGRGGGGVLIVVGYEKVAEETFGLGLACVFEFDPDVHPAWAAEGGVEFVEVVRGCEEEAAWIGVIGK